MIVDALFAVKFAHLQYIYREMGWRLGLKLDDSPALVILKHCFVPTSIAKGLDDI